MITRSLLQIASDARWYLLAFVLGLAACAAPGGEGSRDDAAADIAPVSDSDGAGATIPVAVVPVEPSLPATPQDSAQPVELSPPVTPRESAQPVEPVAPAPPSELPIAANGPVDQSCRTGADCAIKNVGNCCGMFMACVNKDAKTFPDQVQARCTAQGRVSICGMPSISSCECVSGKCAGTRGSNDPVAQ